VEAILACLNGDVLPQVPSRGSVGASGDLAPLAHLALPLIGEGRAWFDGELLDGADALAAAGLEPVRLAAKEGLSLVNGTQFMSALGALGLVRARRLAHAADLACALSLEALQGSRTSFMPQIHTLRPLRGQADSAANVLRLLEGRSSKRTGGATRCRTRTRSAARRRCTARRATSLTTSTTPCRWS
jgi:histidine ammonia-lyase